MSNRMILVVAAAALALGALGACKKEPAKKIVDDRPLKLDPPVPDARPELDLSPPPPPHDEDTPWVSTDGGYQVAFPETPEEQVQTMETEIGKLEVHIASLDKGDHAFLVFWQDQPPKAPKDPKQQLDGQREGMLAEMPGTKVVEQNDITLGSYPGREMRLQVADPPGIELVRVFVVDRRLYQVGMIGGDGYLPAARAFVESFALTKK